MTYTRSRGLPYLDVCTFKKFVVLYPSPVGDYAGHQTLQLSRKPKSVDIPYVHSQSVLNPHQSRISGSLVIPDDKQSIPGVHAPDTNQLKKL